jgi:UDP-glucose 4-epimerase
MKVLVTGGAGYIGSHTCIALLDAGHDVVVLDNLGNASAEALRRVQEIVGRSLRFVEGDVRRRDDLARACADGIDAVVHLAALKAVGESCAEPLRYFDNNIGGTISLLQAMQDHGTRRLVFSSSATVYGAAAHMPVDEDAPLGVTNPYGRSKLVMEDLIRDLCAADTAFGATLLRYFNPVGAHPSGRIGEDPVGVPNNLMPYVAQVACGRRDHLNVFGNDYATVDGTGVRDYLHVMDLADAHLRALHSEHRGARAYNLGSGRGHSVLALVRAFEAASGRPVPLRYAARRPGDVAALYADPRRAERELGWKATRTLADMCADTWRWQSMNPQGYRR